MSLNTIYEIERFCGDLDHPECVNPGIDGALYAGSEAGIIFRIDPSTGTKTIYGETGGSIGGLCLDGSNRVYDCNYGNLRLNRVIQGNPSEIYSVGTTEAKALYPNYPVFDDRGNLYYSDSGDFYKPSGSIFVVRPNGKTEMLYGRHLCFPNGLAIDPSGQWLYVAMSNAYNITRFPILENGLGEPEVYVMLPNILPDGLAFAESGNLYIACYVPDAILRVDTKRKVEVVIQDFAADYLTRPTNVCFGKDSSMLYYANFGGYHINRLDVQEKGMPLRYPIINQ